MTTSTAETTHVLRRGSFETLDVFGPTVEFLTAPESADIPHCMMIGTIPPGISVPLHSHADVESFYVLSGQLQALIQHGDRLEWLGVRSGDFIQVPSGARHAFRNQSTEPVIEVITTTPKLGRFFQEIGRPVIQGVPLPPPTPDNIRRFLEIAARYGYWNATPAENAAAGISLFQ